MKLLLLCSALLLASPAVLPLPAAPTATTSTVYVCISKTSYAYHSSRKCPGLGRCTHEVKGMSTAAAKQLGKYACHKCY